MRKIACMARFLMLLALLVVQPLWGAEALSGRVVAIADGDTLTVLTAEKRQVKIRLGEIDTPEKGQPYSNRARQALADLVFQKDVIVKVTDTDRYGRTVGRVYVGELDVNADMVRRGAAWVFRRYVTDESLFALENAAREAKIGIWGLSEAKQMPPWEWRRRGGTEGAPANCLIKGNINSKGERIYHAPGKSGSYGATKINLSKGERWFCTEEEARQAGWRAPRN